LVQSVRANLKPLFRYFDLRRRALGLRELHYYDTYVPLVPEIETRFTFDQAAEMVLGALDPLGKKYVDVLAEGLRTRRWCDRYETKGKRSGAFSSGSYEAPPYILMNYKEDVFADVYTLAHEAGHSMHSWFAQNSQRFQDYEYPIFLAEVASTFNEELLTHYLLKTTNDPKMRAYIINRQIDDLRGTLYRQTMFAEFEKIIHAVEESGDALTLDLFKSECSIPSSILNACVFRISIMHFTFINMRQGFLLRLRFRSACLLTSPEVWRHILIFCGPVVRSFHWRR
jgi:oligoendopeptidase F